MSVIRYVESRRCNADTNKEAYKIREGQRFYKALLIEIYHHSGHNIL